MKIPSPTDPKDAFKRAIKCFTHLKAFKHNKIYTPNHNLVVLHEDNFEFSKWLVQLAGANVKNICATSHAQPGSNTVKSKGRIDNIQFLKDATICYGVTVESFWDDPRVAGIAPNTKKYDRVLCNHDFSLTDVRFGGCISASKSLLNPGGEVHLLDTRVGKHVTWPLEQMAALNNMQVEEIQFKYGDDNHPYSILRFFPKVQNPYQYQYQYQYQVDEEDEDDNNNNNNNNNV